MVQKGSHTDLAEERLVSLALLALGGVSLGKTHF